MVFFKTFSILLSVKQNICNCVQNSFEKDPEGRQMSKEVTVFPVFLFEICRNKVNILVTT